MDILTHLNYRDCFPKNCCDSLGILYVVHEISQGLYLPIDEMITKILKSLNKNEVIIFCSFVNMVCQTQSYEEFYKFSYDLLGSIGINLPTGKVAFHRENLLHLIVLSIQTYESSDGSLCWFEEQEPGIRYQEDLKKMCQLLLLINSKMNKKQADKDFLKSHILRPYPHYDGNTERSHPFYWRWLKRYWEVYFNLLNKLDENKKKSMEESISIFESSMGLPLRENFKMIAGLFPWFFGLEKISDHTKKVPENMRSVQKFEPHSISSFLINKNKFDVSDLINLIERISLDIEEIKNSFEGSSQKKEDADPFFMGINKFFDKPILKYKDYFIILDWKFFMERLCVGLFWVLWAEHPLRENKNLQNLKASYGHVMEKYFIDLMAEIFGELAIEPKKDGQPDLIIETDTYIFIFEFTVKYFNIASLYKNNLSSLYNDFDELFKKQKRNQEGKFRRLNKYVGDKKKLHPTKKIVPILVTEKWLGSYELVQEMGYNLDQKIHECDLSNLKNQKPIMMGLDEIETFWSLASNDPQKAVDMFVDCIESWRLREDKGPCWFNFGFNVVDFYKDKSREMNNSYKNFYNFPLLLHEIDDYPTV